MDPAWSLDGRTLAFTALSEGVELYLAEVPATLAGDVAASRVKLDGVTQMPAWLADGAVVVEVCREQGCRLVRVDPVDLAATDLVDPANVGENAREPVASPSGARLGFVTDSGGWVFDVATGRATPVAAPHALLVVPDDVGGVAGWLVGETEATLFAPGPMGADWSPFNAPVRVAGQWMGWRAVRQDGGWSGDAWLVGPSGSRDLARHVPIGRRLAPGVTPDRGWAAFCPDGRDERSIRLVGLAEPGAREVPVPLAGCAGPTFGAVDGRVRVAYTAIDDRDPDFRRIAFVTDVTGVVAGPARPVELVGPAWQTPVVVAGLGIAAALLASRWGRRR